MASEFPTIASDPSEGTALPEEDIGGYSAPVNPSDIEAASGYDWASGGLATITAPTRPVDVETQREIDFLHEPVPSDEEAGFLYERLPFLSDADRPAALRSLNRYAADQENNEAQVRQTERQRTFLDPKARTEWMNRKDVKENLGYLDDANAAYDRMAARKFFEEVIAKRPLSDPEYEAQRNDYARMKVGKAKVSDQEVFGIIQKEVEKEKEYDAATEFARGEMLLQKVKAAAEKKPFRKGDVWDSARKMIPAEGPDGLESSLYQEVSRFDAVTEERLRRNMPALGVMYSYMMRKAGAAPTAQMVGWTDSPEQRKEFIDSVLSIPDEDMDEVLHTLQAAITHGQVDKTIPQKMWHDFGKMIAEVSGIKPVFKDMSESARDIDIEAMRNLVNTGQVKSDASGNLVWNPAPTPGRTEERLQPMSAEQKAQALKGLDDLQKLNLMDYRLRRMFDETLGKKEEYFSQKFAGGGPLAVERAVYSGLEQLPQMGLAAINAPMYLAVVGSRSYLDIIDANPKIDRTVAFTMSATEASINWITDRAQLKGLGGLGGVRQLLTLTRKIPLGRPLTRWIGTSIYETGTEYVQDYLSEAGKRAVQEILHAINPDLDVGHIKTFNEINDEFVASLGPTAGTMFFLSAISAGALTWRDVKDPQGTVYNHGHLKSLGLREDDITTLLYETDFDARDRMLQQLAAERTPEQKNDGILYAQQMAEAEKAKIVGETTTVGAAATAAPEDQFKEPRLEPHVQPDGARKFTLYDANGTVVREGMDEGVANAEYNDLVRTSFGEYLQKQVEARQTEEAEAKGVAAETKWNILSAQEKTTLGNILEYEYVKRPTPEQQKAVEGLKRALGKPGSDIVAVSVEQPTTRAGKLALNFVRWFEDTFKKNVVFVASASGESLPFGGAVNSSDPNTIFLNAAGNRNVLSLLGHEWSHTLEKTNPKLWNDIMERMQPMIMDWAVQVGKVDASYDPEERTKEFVANVIGDAFGDPEFWKMVREKDANLFQRMLQAVQEWFDTIIEHASEWGTEGVVKDLKGLRELVSEAMKTAEAGPEAEAGTAAGVQTAAQRHKVQLASRRIEKGFYSKLEDFVSGPKVQKTSSPEQVKATINGAGIKAEEIKWSGVMPKIDEIAAENAGKVPKGDLVTYLEDEGSVEFKEVTLTEKGLSPEDAAEMNDLLMVLGRTPEQNARLGALSKKMNEAQRPRYATYVLPGGENYREVVLAMPSKGSEVYRSSHFPNVPNYVAHMRLNEREGGLFIEEIQSDRHQQGREKGYQEKPRYTVQSASGSIVLKPGGQGRAIYDTREEAEAYGGGVPGWYVREVPGLGIPDAPFRKDWPLAMFKRALRDAVAVGKEWIGWTTGETQAERYDLSKQVSRVYFEPRQWATKEGRRIPSSGDLIVTGMDGNDLLTKQNISTSELSDTIGKEAAEKLFSDTARREGTAFVLQGEGLKVGGEGMKGFYDKMLPNEVGKYVKQWGGKVEQGQVSVPPKTRYFYERQLPSGEWHRAGALGGEDNLEWIQERVEQMNAQGRNEWRVAEDKGEPVPIWKVEITPQMKAGVNEGQVQFALPREEAPRRKLHVPGETVPVTAFDKDAGTFVPTPMKPTKELLKILRVEQRTYNELLKCLAA